MHNFPVTVLDNFFDNPNDVREFALKQTYKPDEGNHWPGERTSELADIDKNFWRHFTERALSLFYNFDNEVIEWTINSAFQKVSSNYSGGWVHTDKPDILTGIVYLNPNTNPEAGTSIFYRNKENPFAFPINDKEKKIQFQNKSDAKKQEKYRLENNNQFEEVIRVSNAYNRLVLFDSSLFHSANGYFGGEDGQDARLALVFFVKNIKTKSLPVARSKYY